jgi:C4-dicarboxylate-specific signal transduction histidine kinase
MDDTLAKTGLQFFGTVSASISHEIKNRMAVVNEQAGLLKDLVHLAGKGREIHLDRLLRLAESLKTQVDLTDGIIKNMNRFAHSVESFHNESNLVEVLSLTAGLARRTADNKGVRIDVKPSESPPNIVTAPFILMNLIWICLEAMMPLADMECPVTMGCEKTDSGAAVWLSVKRWPGTGGPDLPDSTGLLLNMLQAGIVLDRNKKTLRIELQQKPTADC